MNKTLDMNFNNELDRSFYDHLMQKDNQKIFFSGRYGIGKTYFLDNFFKEYSKEAKLLPIFISPVNYAVADNSDIFPLIKVDILRELYKTEQYNVVKAEIEAKKKGIIQSLKEYAKIKPLDLTNHVFKSLTAISPFVEKVSNAVDSLKDMIADIKEFQDSLNRECAINKTVVKLTSGYLNEEGSFFEKNIITNFIYEILQSFEGYTKILVVDDLDRLDPKHVFRIMNVLSSHYDQKSSEFKFGFDKIVVVGHVRNLVNVFKHFYGDNTDFNGYFDKFTSSIPYEFNNDKIIDAYIEKTLGKNIHGEERKITKIAIRYLFPEGVTFRELLRAEPSDIKTIISPHPKDGTLVNVTHDHVFLIKLVELLLKLSGGKAILLKKFQGDFPVSLPFDDEAIKYILIGATLLLRGDVSFGRGADYMSLNFMTFRGTLHFSYKGIENGIMAHTYHFNPPLEIREQMQIKAFIGILRAILNGGYFDL